ncbi:hypothetical protein ACFRI7_11670 [Streptomyces sp. NPDC056716]|uniref:hypothetical protein n=1 Tax=unclassified Streptomyces TaxID=2593676 RepID=UPI00367463A1
MPHPVNFRLDGYEAAVEDADSDVTGTAVDLTSLAEHHTDDDRHSYYVLYDESATWGHPDMSHIVAVHIRRDHAVRRYRVEEERVPLAVMAQSWLIARGCPRTAIGLPLGTGLPASDDATRALEDRLIGEADRFDVLDESTDESCDSWEITVLLHAVDEHDPVPFRILLEHGDYDSRTRTLREGAFATFEEASAWLEEHRDGDSPVLPPPPDIAPAPDRSAGPGVPAPRSSSPGSRPIAPLPVPGPGAGAPRHR